MKIKLQKTIFTLLLPAVVLINGFFWVGANNASAVGAAYFPQNTTVTLGVGDFTIRGGSDADSVVTTNTTVTITISNGQSFTLESSEQKEMFTDSSYSYECKSGSSSITITPSATQTVVITPQSTTCSIDAGGGGGSGSQVSASTSTSTPTPTVSPTVSATPTPVPSTSSQQATPASQGFVTLTALNLKEGDVISAAGSDDPDVYIVNPHGYKRLFLNPVIFGFYGHLGGFAAVKNTPSTTRDVFVTSGLFRNCETEDPKVFGLEATGEDTGVLHWVNTTGEQAVADDPEFFKKVFCINTREFNWYDKGTEYTSVGQVSSYSRGN